MTHRRRRLAPLLLYLAGVGAVLAACWVIPYRLAYGERGSYYTFAYIPDEYTYAQRVQPLIEGATRSNPVNGICDPGIVSQFFLEDAVRACITLSRLDVVTWFWIWRVLYPVVLAGALLVLASRCLRSGVKPWGPALRCAAAAFAFGVLFALYEALVGGPVPHMWINRVPSNVEFPLSVLLAWLLLRFVETPAARRGMALSAAGVALVYLRPYAAVPWGLALAGIVVCMTVRRQLGKLAVGAIVGTVAAGLAPWVAIAWWNRQCKTYVELLGRYWLTGQPYEVHKRWAVHLGVAVLLVLLGLAVARRWRPLAWFSAAVLAALPFLCGLSSMAHELLLDDRFSPFYLVMLLTLALLAFDNVRVAWHGRSGLCAARRWIVGLTACTLGLAVWLAARNAQYDFYLFHTAQCSEVADDCRYVPAYKWIRAHTPQSALFLVDDGSAWIGGEVAARRLLDEAMIAIERNDLFQIVACRRRVHSTRMHGLALTNADFADLVMLELGTFKCLIEKSRYVSALKRFPPEYMFWRKTAPVPRGPYGGVLQGMRTVVYADEVCEIWQMRYARAGP